MIRLVAVSLAIGLIPQIALATDLSEILERGRDASYRAEQMISCATPDGSRGALLSIEQSGSDLLVESGMISGTAVAVGAGGWMLLHQDGVVDQTGVAAANQSDTDLYTVSDLGSLSFLGREATAYRLERDGLIRAELVLDDITGVLVRLVTFDAGGETYCVRRFISFEPGARHLPPREMAPEALISSVPEVDVRFPEIVVGFARLDQYEDADGFRFTYYSDGFFSFAVFQTPALVVLPEAVDFKRGKAGYRRSFTAGQVYYAWETRHGGMAMVGDLPPDLHESVLEALPQPEDPGLFRRLWRSLFG